MQLSQVPDNSDGIVTNPFRFEATTGGAPADKEVLLDENDEIWRELRHQHIAVATQYV